MTMSTIQNPEAGAGGNTPGSLAPTNPLSRLYQSAFVCARRLVSLNIKATRSILENNMSGVSALIGAAGSPDLLERQTELAEGFMQQALGYARDFNEVIAQNQADLVQLIQAQASEPMQGGLQPPVIGAMSEILTALMGSASSARDQLIASANEVAQGVVASAPVVAAPAARRKRASVIKPGNED